MNMNDTVKFEFPNLYTKSGKLRKQPPHKFKCSCGHTFSKMRRKDSVGGIKFQSTTCEKCGDRAKENISYNVWCRKSKGDIEKEDFILNEIRKSGTITKNELQKRMAEAFNDQQFTAIGNLVYFSYILVDQTKRDLHGVIEYSLNEEKDPTKRYELIR